MDGFPLGGGVSGRIAALEKSVSALRIKIATLRGQVAVLVIVIAATIGIALASAALHPGLL